MTERMMDCALADVLPDCSVAKYSRVACCAVFGPWCSEDSQYSFNSSTLPNDFWIGCPPGATPSYDSKERPGSHSSNLDIARRYNSLVLWLGCTFLWPGSFNYADQNFTLFCFRIRSYGDTLLSTPMVHACARPLLAVLLPTRRNISKVTYPSGGIRASTSASLGCVARSPGSTGRNTS